MGFGAGWAERSARDGAGSSRATYWATEDMMNFDKEMWCKKMRSKSDVGGERKKESWPEPLHEVGLATSQGIPEHDHRTRLVRASCPSARLVAWKSVQILLEQDRAPSADVYLCARSSSALPSLVPSVDAAFSAVESVGSRSRLQRRANEGPAFPPRSCGSEGASHHRRGGSLPPCSAVRNVSRSQAKLL